MLAGVEEVAIIRALQQGRQASLRGVDRGLRRIPRGWKSVLLQPVFKPEKSFEKELAKREWRHIMRVLLGVTEAVIKA